MSSKADARAAINARLANAPTFHPSNVDLFADWTLQSGDIVTVQSGNDSYSMPIFSMNYKWNGSSKLTASNSGNEYRDSLSKMAEKEYNKRGGGGGYGGGVRDAEQDQIWGNEFYSEDGILHSLIVQTTTYIMTAVENVQSNLYSFIEQTPEMIHAEVGVAVSGLAQSVIEQTATYIRTEVTNAASSISQTVIEQTASYVRTEVTSVASGIAWSVITQTMTGIITEVGGKARVFVRMTDPVAAGLDVHEGDFWVQSNGVRNWNNFAQDNWSSRGTNLWRQYYGSKIFVRHNNAWEEVNDSSAAVEQEVEIVHNKEEFSLLGRKVDLQGEEYNSRLQVTAQQIRGDVSAAQSSLYSVVLQTATNVFSGVYNKALDTFSTIEQTADSITLSVSAAKSSLYSTIQQTATQIRTEVGNTASGLQSQITQNAGNIELKVSKNGVISSINQTSESVTINAAKVNLNGYVQATDLTTTWLNSLIGSINNLSTKDVTVTGGLTCSGRVSGNAISGMSLEIGGASFTNVIVSASVSGNTLTLTPLTGNAVTFSKATTLSGEWSSGVYTVTASPQGNTINTGGLTVQSANARRDGDLLYVPILAGTTPTGYEAWINWKNRLTAHTNSTGGLSRYNTGSMTTLYIKLGDEYSSAGQHYWYYKNSNSSLTTYYS